ncbi:hypothetical protein NFI96_034684, partial [Prochilodus magdalenae]
KSKVVEQERGGHPPNLKPTSPFGAEEPEVLTPEHFVQEDHLNGKESPFKEIAPIKTSSPIDLVPAGEGAGDPERPETSPLLFVVEDEEPVEGGMSKSPINEKSEFPKEFLQEDSESLVSPPGRLEFGKPATQPVASVSRCMPVPCPDLPAQICQTSAPETREESQIDRSPSVSPAPPELPKCQPKKQAAEVKLDVEVKESSFQLKLRNAFQPKTSWKQESQKTQAHALSVFEPEDDFMILEDDAPVLFTIPRKAESSLKEKHAPEGVSLKPDKKLTSEVDSNAKLRDEPDAAKSKKTKAKRGKTSNVGDKDAVTQAVLEEQNDPLTVVEEVVGVCKQRTNNSTDKLVNNTGKNGNEAKIAIKKPASKRKNPVKLTGDAKNRQGHTSNVKKKPNKAKSTVKDTVIEDSAKSDKQNNDTATLTNKQILEEQEQVLKLHNHTEPPLEPTEQPAMQSTTVEKTSKQLAAKQGPLKKLKKTQKTIEDTTVEELPVPDVSPEGSVTSKRKRKPPGEWWLTNDIQGDTQAQEVAVQESLQELKPNKKIKRNKPPAVSTQSTEEHKSRSEPVKAVTVQKMPRKVKKSKLTSDPKNPKIAAGKGKLKSAAPTPHETQSKTPTPIVGEEVAVDENGQFTPPACSPPPSRQSRTPGEERLFVKTYTRDSQCGSAQKHPSSALHRPESLAVKRQRKPTSNWWEVPQSQGSENCSPQTSKQQMPPVDKAANEVISRKTTLHAQKKNRINMVQTPKSVKSSLATFDAILDSGKPGSLTVRGLESKQKGRRNLLHSLEDQSEQSSENIHSDQHHGSSHATFDVCTSGVTTDPFTARKKPGARLSVGSNRASDDFGFKSGPSSLIDLERFDEHEDSDLPSTRVIPHMQHVPRVLSDCDFCGPPLRPIVLETEDWDNLCVWFAHLWPSASKDGKVFSAISPDDFHWHSHCGRAMGHMVDLQNNTFSNGKILLGSYMKKPPQVDLHAETVFNVVSSCVRVEIDGVRTVYNSGQTFMMPCGKSYSIHNVCREPAVLWYHRMLPNDIQN